MNGSRSTGLKGFDAPMRRTVDGEIVSFNCIVPGFMVKKGQLEDDLGPRLVAMVRNIEASLGLH